MEAQILIKLSLVLDKMEVDLSSVHGKTNEETGLKLLSTLVSKIHKAEEELYDLIAFKRGVTVEEAKKENIIEFIKEIIKIEGMTDFLS